MRVLLVDDHPIFIAGVKTFVAQLDASVDVHDATSLDAALAAVERTAFDLVLLDLNMPRVTGLEALYKLKRLVAAPIVIVSGNDNDSDIATALEVGAAGYIPKTHNQKEMITALQEVLARGIYVPPQARGSDLPGPAKELTDRQVDVLQWLLQGKSNKVIASKLGVAEGTVKAHLDAIYQKLGVNSRLQAMARAYALGLVDRFKKMQ
jgi:DNA-binding NarL/FixJ family response regulator